VLLSVGLATVATLVVRLAQLLLTKEGVTAMAKLIQGEGGALQHEPSCQTARGRGCSSVYLSCLSFLVQPC